MAQNRGSSQQRDPRSREIDGLVDEVIAATPATGGVTVVDLGGGTGGQAVRLATAGHTVAVVDPSADALAAVARRGMEAGLEVGTLRGVQGDAETVAESLGAGFADVVLCHGVLEFVDDPSAALVSIATVLRAGGRLSLQVTQREGACLAAVVKGQFARARAIMSSADGRWGPADPLQHRFDERTVTALLEQAGLQVHAVQGIRTFGEVAPQPRSAADAQTLEELNVSAATEPAFRALAPSLHVSAVKASDTAVHGRP